ncbi:ATP-binding cassette domain-containing protein [Salipiger manganoxidans]|uniref:Putative thiamine transport system ATP-binding protein n=1 Tax=Salipiger marinus TaxID=555512 RepID=A0A1G8IQ08_9RHOB|nr:MULTISPECIES: ATP-binding cassette domain-containing protein [Salipiger]MCD1618197.1 ATP-binding cassette domain-containing protein [Salipiger manganoxidans]SDI20590.1 putative thiamine transport system ATP-binding protein [Salipiger marinus]
MAEGLVLDHVILRRGGDLLLTLDARVAPGEVLTVMGRSGSGKSTLLSAIIGQLDPAFTLEGRILLNGTDLTRRPAEARQVGILFQDDLLFPHLSVAGNLGFGLPRALRGAARSTRIEAALQEVELAGYGPRDPATLSGGQKARVALMRMLLAEPRALLLDEPFSRLDAGLRAQIRALVLARAQARGLPVLLVTHDAEDARAAGGRVVTLG